MQSRDRSERRCFIAPTHTLADIAAAPKHRPMLCCNCPRPHRRGRFWVVLTGPGRGDATRALGLAVCETCATEPAAVEVKEMLGPRRSRPDACVITPGEAGHT